MVVTMSRRVTIIDSRQLSYNTNMALTKKRKDPAAVALGRKGGNKGGPARAAKSKAKDGNRAVLNIDEAKTRYS